MRYILKRVCALSLVLAMALSFTACGKKVGDIKLDSGVNAIYIDEDGAVSYGVTEKFADKDYDKDALEKYINDEVKKYNSSSTASVDDAISVDKFEVEDKEAYLILKLATVYDFNSYIQNYNKAEEGTFYAGTIEERDDCKIKGEFTSPDKKETLKAKEIKKMSNANILIVDSKYKVEIGSDVKYISSNCKVDEDGIVTTSDKEKSYIVY